MTNPTQTIPGLPAAPSLGGSEEFWINQSGTDRRATTNQIVDFVNAKFPSETGSYSGQLSQTFTQVANSGPLNIFSYLTLDQQTAVQSGTSTVDFSPILVEAVNAASFNPKSSLAASAAPIIYFPPGLYNFLSTVNLKQTVVIIGAGGNGAGSFGWATILSWPKDTTGIIVNRANTFGNGTVSATTGADGSVIRDLAIISQAVGTDITAHGVWFRARATLQNVFVGGFAGNQVNIVATTGSGGATEGNANGWFLSQCSFNGASLFYNSTAYGVNGVYVQGGDSNAGIAEALNFANLNGCGYAGSDFLGNSIIGGQAATCGLKSFVSQSGTTYYGNATTTSALMGSTTPGTDPTVWVATTTIPSAPVWVNGGTYYPGQPWSTTGSNSVSVMIGNYTEGGQGSPPNAAQRTVVIPGINAGVAWTGNGAVISSNQNFLSFNQSAGLQTTFGGETVTSTIGEVASATILKYIASTNWTGGFRIKGNGAQIRIDNANSDSFIYGYWYGPNTTLKMGGSTNRTGGTQINLLGISDGNCNLTSITNTRSMTNSTASPTTAGWGVGSISWNRTPSIGNPIGWMLTTSSGGGDTWTALANL